VSDGDTASSVVIVGAGGFGREVLGYVLDAYGADPTYTVAGFLDDDPPDLGGLGLAYPVLDGIAAYQPRPADRFVIAVGEPKLRARLAESLASRGAAFLTVIHPNSYVSTTATVGEGCIIAPFATIGAHASLGDHSVLTFCASIGHDATVGRWCALSPHSVTNGGSRVGDRVFLGAHAVINPLQSVGDGAKVAAGAVVYRSVAPNMLAAGNPARARPIW
jgi:sugar O-acyltransferase (sialic acid O-acetyltransferase NeuD family)